MLKLVFPGGEHAPVLLDQGNHTIGTDPGCAIALTQPGVEAVHCELRLAAGRAMLHVSDGAAVEVNERPVQGLIALRAGDTLSIASVRMRLVALPAAVPATPATAAASMHDEEPSEASDPGLTRVRPALPRFVLRGVSGTVLGRSFPLAGTATVGRAAECVLHLDDAGLSRQHARLIPGPDGVQVEDLGSTNGTFVNGRRIRSALAKGGDEIAFDTVRFRLLDANRSELEQLAPKPQQRVRMPLWWWVGVAAVLLVLVWVAFGLR